jgi:hypothetical protein
VVTIAAAVVPSSPASVEEEGEEENEGGERGGVDEAGEEDLPQVDEVVEEGQALEGPIDGRAQERDGVEREERAGRQERGPRRR